MSYEDHWPNNRQHVWKFSVEDGREHCGTCGVMRSMWNRYPCGSHPWTLHTPSGMITAGITENGGFWPLEWPDTLDEDRAAEAMRDFFREHGEDIKIALRKPEIVLVTEEKDEA